MDDVGPAQCQQAGEIQTLIEKGAKIRNPSYPTGAGRKIRIDRQHVYRIPVSSQMVGQVRRMQRLAAAGLRHMGSDNGNVRQRRLSHLIKSALRRMGRHAG